MPNLGVDPPRDSARRADRRADPNPPRYTSRAPLRIGGGGPALGATMIGVRSKSSLSSRDSYKRGYRQEAERAGGVFPVFFTGSPSTTAARGRLSGSPRAGDPGFYRAERQMEEARFLVTPSFEIAQDERHAEPLRKARGPPAMRARRSRASAASSGPARGRPAPANLHHPAGCKDSGETSRERYWFLTVLWAIAASQNAPALSPR